MVYLPVAYANKRLNDCDFLSVAVPLINLRKQLKNEELLKKAARIIVLESNYMLNSK